MKTLTKNLSPFFLHFLRMNALIKIFFCIVLSKIYISKLTKPNKEITDKQKIRIAL
jgi:hypothetical protein